MSDNSPTPVEVDEVEDNSLATFKAEFFNPKKVEEPVKEEEEGADVEDADAETVETETDTDEVQDGEEGEEEEVETPSEKPHKNRKTAKERISELSAKNRETEAARLAEKAAYQAELTAMQARLAKLEQPEPKPAPKVEQKGKLPDYFPDEDAVDENGELVYPLGKFDPQYNADVVRATMRHEREEAAKVDEQKRAETEVEQAQTALISEWNGKLEAAEKELPDLREKIAGLEETFSDLDPNFGIFLAENIMRLARGPEVLEYLADHISEAEAIVAAHPTAALIKLGTIEGRLPAKRAEGNAEKKVSNAPTPPVTTRGRGSASRVAADTDNLGAFKREFFK